MAVVEQVCGVCVCVLHLEAMQWAQPADADACLCQVTVRTLYVNRMLNCCLDERHLWWAVWVNLDVFPHDISPLNADAWLCDVR